MSIYGQARRRLKPTPWDRDHHLAGAAPINLAANKFVVAGHLCVDLTPSRLTEALPHPGNLAPAGPLRISTGGAVPNVGVALWRLGYKVKLVALLGEDWLGAMCRQLLEPLGPQPGLRLAAGQSTSYSIVIAPNGQDRSFLHCTGANTGFISEDVHDEDLDGGTWLHFGYPPVMPSIAAKGGKELATLFRRAAERKMRTSMDFCSLDSAAMKIDWEEVLRNCAPFVTVFAPSIEELRAILNYPPQREGDIGDVSVLGCHLLRFGFSIVVIKLGVSGLYMATSKLRSRLSKWSLGGEWVGRELLAPCFQSNFVNASGAGDCTIAGLISSIARGDSPEAVLVTAAAVGASSTEAGDASTGVQPMKRLEARISDGWKQMGSQPPDQKWHRDERFGVWTRLTAKKRRWNEAETVL